MWLWRGLRGSLLFVIWLCSGIRKQACMCVVAARFHTPLAAHSLFDFVRIHPLRAKRDVFLKTNALQVLNYQCAHFNHSE